MVGERVARVLAPGELPGIRDPSVERGQRPRQPAVHVEPHAADPLGRVVHGRTLIRRSEEVGQREERVAGRRSALGDARVVAGGGDRRSDHRRPVDLLRRADPVEVAADVADQRARLVALRCAGEDRPRLRLAEDHSLTDLPWPGVRARVPALAGPLAPQRRHVAGAAGAQLLRERVVPAQVGELRQLRVRVRELGGHEHRLGHLQELGREVRPVARAPEGPRQVAAVRPEQRLLVPVGDLDVVPGARGAACRLVRELLVEELRVPGGEPVLARGEEQPEVEVVGGAEVDPLAHRPGAVGELGGARLRRRLEPDRVAEDLARERGIRVGHRQHVVRPAAEAQVVAEVVLVVAALRDRVVAAELLVHRRGAQEVGVPAQLARDPRPAGAEARLRQPARPRPLAPSERVAGGPVLRHEPGDPLVVGHAVDVAERDRPAGPELHRRAEREQRIARVAGRRRLGELAAQAIARDLARARACAAAEERVH